MPKPRILIIDDDVNICFAFERTFESLGYQTFSAHNGGEGRKAVKDKAPDLIFMDVMMPDVNGLDLLKEIKAERPSTPVIMITGFSSMNTAIQATKLGAYEYMPKPLDVDKVRLLAKRALEMVELQNSLYKAQNTEHIIEGDKHEIIGQSEAIHDVFKKIGAASVTPNSTNILIHGESGTGKELVARSIHKNSEHPNQPFMAINCTALPENLFESALFGHEKGAYTGAHEQKKGIIEEAGEGAVFLDEIGELSLHMQQKLLRVIQEREFMPVGGTRLVPVKARFIAATNRDLALQVKEKSFREDLFYRLNVFPVFIPALRTRIEDIPVLAQYFLGRYNHKLKKNIVMIAPEVIAGLKNYPFPGNVRELENIIERAVILEKSNILSETTVHGFFNETGRQAPASDEWKFPENYEQARKQGLAAFEKKFLRQLLYATSGNVTQAADKAGISRQAFQRLMKKHHFYAHQFKNENIVHKA